MSRTYTALLTAIAVEGEVVLIGGGAMCGAYVPEAVLASLEPMRAAEQAIRDRALQPS